jgi:hypothetical protein
MLDHAQKFARGNLYMDFIERWLGISPDGGDGSTEALYILAVVAILALVFHKRIVQFARGFFARK